MHFELTPCLRRRVALAWLTMDKHDVIYKTGNTQRSLSLSNKHNRNQEP